MTVNALPRRRSLTLAASTALAAATAWVAPANAWEPTRNVEFIVPAGTGGGADQMARMIQGIIAKHNLMKQTMVVVNKADLLVADDWQGVLTPGMLQGASAHEPVHASDIGQREIASVVDVQIEIQIAWPDAHAHAGRLENADARCTDQRCAGSEKPLPRIHAVLRMFCAVRGMRAARCDGEVCHADRCQWRCEHGRFHLHRFATILGAWALLFWVLPASATHRSTHNHECQTAGSQSMNAGKPLPLKVAQI